MDDTGLDCDVVVAGAGLSGLTCAHLLIEAGLNIIILEAADRIGGRIHSVTEQRSGKYAADLGPTWVWPHHQPIIARWLDRLKVKTFSQFETGNAVIDFDASTPVRHQPVPGQHGIRRLHGGPQTLVNTLSQTVTKDAIKTNHAVIAIAIEEGTVAITTNNPAAPIIRTKRVVVAIPPRMAHQNISWPIELKTGVLREISEIPTWMAAQAKAVILYDKPFWRKQGLSGRVVSQVGPLVETHDHSQPKEGQASLFGFIGWPPTERRSNPSELRQQIASQLVRCFGPEADRYNEIYIEDWSINSMICSELDLTRPPAHPLVVSELVRTQHCDGRIYFSVAETALQSPGLIEGAFSAAEDTAKSLIADLNKN